MERKIQHITGASIDRAKWDTCIERASNGLIYGFSWYLDKMATNWDGLILGDYEAVMPLPWRKKWGVHYVYQPFLTAQLGVFGQRIDGDLVQAFLKAVPGRFKLLEFPLNQGNVFPIEGFGIYPRANYVLSLNRSFNELQAGYRENARRNVRKAAQYGCRPVKDLDVESVVQLAQLQNPEMRQTDADHFIEVVNRLHRQGRAVNYGIESARGELLASAVFLFSHGRAYYLLVGNHPNGRTLGASHALIDQFIRDHAEHELLLDFEGSDLRNIAFFYSSFGAVEERYLAVKHERLPLHIRVARSILRS